MCRSVRQFAKERVPPAHAMINYTSMSVCRALELFYTKQQIIYRQSPKNIFLNEIAKISIRRRRRRRRNR